MSQKTLIADVPDVLIFQKSLIADLPENLVARRPEAL
jgi:hypothetical protein